jgi:solute carrier family 12 (potassium/chloride transporter), member 4/6
MKKKGRGMSIFLSILDGDYPSHAEDAKTMCHQLVTYIEYKKCEGVAEIVVAPTMSETMGTWQPETQHSRYAVP